MPLKEHSDLLKSIDKTWTLFLDRDGVINDEKHLAYINTWEEFSFYHGVLEAIKIFSERFGRVIIITNQRGIAKGLTLPENLKIIHENLSGEVAKAGGRIDSIYFCGDLDDNSTHRKPNTGMGLQAQIDFPEIDFAKTIMVGNTLSDMQFGKNLLVALTIFLSTTRPEVPLDHPLIDMVFTDLISFANAL
jgi:histidinol-phosphate phosphatase family protein